MAQLFLSYAREDRECAELLARALASRGWSVWWDRHIAHGDSYSVTIAEELAKARCVIVLWSRHAVASQWVREEAADAKDRDVLVPVRIEDIRPPLGFRELQTADLFDWRRGFDHPEFEPCLSTIEWLVRRKSHEMPLPDEFRISQDGKQFLAPDAATLRRWAAEGRVRADSHVYHPSFDRWVQAREVPSLQDVFPKPAPKPVAPVTPAQEYSIQQNGQQFSAPDLPTLRLWAAEGRVDSQSRIYEPRLGRWVDAWEIPELQSVYRKTPGGPRPAPPPNRALGLTISFVIGILILIVVAILVLDELMFM